MLSRYNAKQQKELLEALTVDLTNNNFLEGFRAPDLTEFAAYDSPMEYELTKLFAVLHATAVVREYQWQGGGHRWLSEYKIPFHVVRTFKPKPKLVKGAEQRRLELSEEQLQQENSFYLFRYPPAGCPLPLEGSQWRISWISWGAGGKQIHEEDEEKWVVFVRSLALKKRQQARADFLVVAQSQEVASSFLLWIASTIPRQSLDSLPVVAVHGPRARAHGPGWAGFFLQAHAISLCGLASRPNIV